MALTLDSLKESNIIVYLIKTSENDRVRNIRNFLTPVERTAKIVVKETETHRKFNRMFSDLCMVAVTALSDIEDALYEYTHPGSSAVDADINEIEEISEKKLIADLSRYAAAGSKLGAAYMENLGAISIKSTARKKRERVSQELRPAKKKVKAAKEKSANLMTEGLGSLDDLILTNGSIQLASSIHGVKRITDLSKEDFRLGTLQELQVAVNPWLISAPETGLIPRTTVEREKKQNAHVASPIPPIMEICLTSDPSLFLHKWESREYALNVLGPSGAPSPSLSSSGHARKRRRPSPSTLNQYPRRATSPQMGSLTSEAASIVNEHSADVEKNKLDSREMIPAETSEGGKEILSSPSSPSVVAAAVEGQGGGRAPVPAPLPSALPTESGHKRSGLRPASFFPRLQNPYTAEVAPPIMRSIVHCGVAHLDLPI